MPPKRRTSAASGNAAQSKQQPPKRSALSLLDTDSDDKKPAPKRSVKRVRKTQTQPRTKLSSHGQEDEDADENGSDDAGGDIPHVQVANINRKRSKPRNAPPATVEEYLMEQNQQAKEFLKGFKAELVESQTQAEESSKTFKQELHNVQTNDNEKDFRKVYATLKAATSGKTKNSNELKEMNPLFTKGEKLIKICRDILQRHQIAVRDSQQDKPTVPREIWEQDHQKMRQLLDYGKDYGQKLVEGIISPDVKGDDSPTQEKEKEAGLSETETLAIGLFDGSKKKSEETERWGRIAYAQARALAAVVKTVP
ncbi:hypothetical protein NEUTE1DRAFT_138685 [Neurospora tetrasperma FGSC 2508]|uniref:Uncharacterized protein n=1 Tax=Neurospora tetrasperma (strain FGSC 2508 / ATCC MYA-4615 / P0657) TaxID=510951 RepID=F8MQD6_NEUT8|nr:uncharacterized protein NEUTE1DRAFT_138685 [Neurospora tetrasperma FGSC 2508]EGO56566.1 hypothetical protein NEUTE1DRAFT_138685 [Neurospora tetrasperma FGSC 2508]EGZ70566.1 hypothetical protein NEUTE2DRAFT_140010 [Neurospora tetrasperma FGSC 2509]